MSCSQNVHFHDSLLERTNLGSIVFAALVSSRVNAFLVGPYMFFWPCHFDAYGPHTGPFLLWFCKEIARGPYGSCDNKQLLDEVFVISRIIKVEVRVISRSRDLDYSGYHKNRI